MKNSALDVSPWNLSVPLVLLAACGRTLPLPPAGSDTDATTTEDPSDPTNDPTVPGECQNSEDCPSGYYCYQNQCLGYSSDDDYCGDYCCYDKCCYGGCYYYECYSDDECGPDGLCEDYMCVDKPGPAECQSPVAFTDPVPITSHSGNVSLAFVETANGPWRELVIADSTQVVVHNDAGTTVVAELPSLSIDVGDLDGDGDQDLVVLSTSFLHSFLYDAAQGIFVPGPESPLFGKESGVVTLADFDGNTTKDAFVTTSDGTGWFEGLGDGGFNPIVVGVATGICGLIAVPSASLEGADDVMFGNSAQAYYAIANPQGFFVENSLGGEGGLGSSCPLATGDFDADGLPDAVMLSRSRIGVLSSWAGVAGFPRAQTWMTATHDVVAVADLDVDGADDVVLAGESVNATLRFGTGGREPDALGCYATIPLGFDPQVLVVGDHNGDGRHDLVGADDDTVWVANGVSG